MQSLPTPPGQWLVLLPVLIPLAGAALLLLLRQMKLLQLPLAVLIAAVTALCDFVLVMRVAESGPQAMTMGNWLPPFGIAFTVDALGAGFAFAAALVVTIVLLPLGADAPDRARRDGLYPQVLLLLAGVSGAFVTGDLFNLYVWFEVMLIASFGLLALGRQPMQLDGTVKYGFPNFMATSIFLLALGLLYGLMGTLNMADLIGASARADKAALAAIAALLLVGFGMKAAGFPLNTWLAASYHTPPPAIAALLAALLTKVGAYALIRSLAMVLPDARVMLEPALAVVAVATLTLGPLAAIAETGLRRLIGFLLIGGIGAMLAGLALGTEQGLAGAASYGIHAMLALGALYVIAGLVEKLTGAGDTRAMGGLLAMSPLIAMVFGLALFAVAGVPPLSGFWPKFLLVTAGIDRWLATGDMTALTLWLAVLLNALLSLIAVARLFAHVAWRAAPLPGFAPQGPRQVMLTSREERMVLWPAALLVMGLVGLGLWPEPIMGFGMATAKALLDPAAYIAATQLAGGSP
jgi:multicomponent Na+:H+ antiporter subunit D